MLYLCRLSCGVEAIYDTLFALGQGRICEPLQNFNAKKKESVSGIPFFIPKNKEENCEIPT